MMTMEKLVELYRAREKSEEKLKAFTNERNQSLSKTRLGILSIEDQIIRDVQCHLLYEALHHAEHKYDEAIAEIAQQQ
jgi:hypothetical protein